MVIEFCAFTVLYLFVACLCGFILPSSCDPFLLPLATISLLVNCSFRLLTTYHLPRRPWPAPHQQMPQNHVRMVNCFASIVKKLFSHKIRSDVVRVTTATTAKHTPATNFVRSHPSGGSGTHGRVPACRELAAHPTSQPSLERVPTTYVRTPLRFCVSSQSNKGGSEASKPHHSELRHHGCHHECSRRRSASDRKSVDRRRGRVAARAQCRVGGHRPAASFQVQPSGCVSLRRSRR